MHVKCEAHSEALSVYTYLTQCLVDIWSDYKTIMHPMPIVHTINLYIIHEFMGIFGKIDNNMARPGVIWGFTHNL